VPPDRTAAALLAVLLLLAPRPRLSAQEPLPLVPLPAGVTRLEGVFVLPDNALIVMLGPRQDEMRRLGRFTNEAFRERAGEGPSLRHGGTVRRGNIVLRVADPLTGDGAREGYQLLVTPESIVVSAAAHAGLFYGIQTLRQLIRPDGSVPAVRIDDRPRFSWRGMHLDVGRHIFPVAFIKRYLDLMARYKLNTFHWHLTEDQGWRLEIRRFPRLATVGGCRRETMVERNFDPFVGDGRPYCGYYTRAEVREIVRYAAERYITVVPEIDMPGHMLAALAAYPELACTPGPFEVGTRWGVYDDILCPSEQTFSFLEGVLREVMSLFPSTFIHIGGDEAPKTRWRESPLVREIIRREGLRDEEAVQGWFNRRIERFLNSNGRRLIGWDEILEGGLAPNAAVMSWRGTSGGLAAASEGHDVVMSPTSHLYFDYYQGDPRFEPLAIGGFLPLDRVYSYEPVPDGLDSARHRHILGAQGNVWTEYLRTAEQVEYMALPRMLALAEVVWSPRGARDWNSFSARLPARLAELDSLGVNYRIPHVTGLEEDRLTLADRITVSLGVPIAGAVIRYTLDGSDPLGAEFVWRYESPFEIALGDAPVIVTARAYLPNGRASAPRAASVARTALRAAERVDEAALRPGLRVSYYEAALGSVRQMDTLRALSAAIAGGVALPGFARAEDFALLFEGFVRVDEPGIYRFRLTSDDGSALWVGGTRVVDNDGLHGTAERSGQIALASGFHPLRIAYFQRGGGKDLSLLVERDDGAERRSVAARLYHR
jgi:hexosaminidase